MMFVETPEGKPIADALVILGGYCLTRMSVEGTGRRKFVPYEPERTPADMIRRSMSHLLERFRNEMNIPHADMYQQYGKAKGAKGAR